MGEVKTYMDEKENSKNCKGAKVRFIGRQKRFNSKDNGGGQDEGYSAGPHAI